MFTPSQTQQLLNELGISPKKKLGQNFLIDPNIVRKTISLTQPTKDDTVIEVGPGLGTLTAALLDTGATLYAVELDPALHAHLSNSLKEEYPDKFHLTHGDAVKLPLAAYQPVNTNYHIIANLPYNISTPWLDAVLSQKFLPKSLTLLLQKETAVRFTSMPGSKNFSAISIFLNSAYSLFDTHKVSSNCFYPKPSVDSLIIHLRLNDNPFFFKQTTRDFIRQCFTQRRKQLASILRPHQQLPHVAAWLKYLQTENIALTSRPDTLPISAWQELDKLFSA